ncbi:MAG: hypothetical protein M1826_005991 [Phylliscum demangeonii]|nr:MAG: hypothetical protein M1826_005991 [Phylliscum demangeonii]
MSSPSSPSVVAPAQDASPGESPPAHSAAEPSPAALDNEEVNADDDEEANGLGDDDSAGGLFGDGSEAEDVAEPEAKSRPLSDDEVDASQEEGGSPRAASIPDEDGSQEDEGPAGKKEARPQLRVMETTVARHPLPESTNGEAHVIRFPNFIGVEPLAFDPDTFQLPQTDHHSALPPSTTFSPYAVALNTLRWRRSRHDPATLESDSRILVWSDGSMTLQMANNPESQFELQPKPLVPSSFKTAKRTPSNPTGSPYDAKQDSLVYLTVPHEAAYLLRASVHITSSLNVTASADVNEEELRQIHQQAIDAVRKEELAAKADRGIEIINIAEDPELAKKRAEIAERDRIRQQKKLQTSIAREAARVNRALARAGGGGGLSIGDLETDDMPTPSRARGQRVGQRVPPARKKAARRHRDSDSSEEEGVRPGRNTREDDYDREDGFVVDDDDDDDDDEADAPADEDDAEADGPPKRRKANGARGPKAKRRRVSEEDEE